jgi:hypothetical protein
MGTDQNGISIEGRAIYLPMEFAMALYEIRWNHMLNCSECGAALNPPTTKLLLNIEPGNRVAIAITLCQKCRSILKCTAG